MLRALQLIFDWGSYGPGWFRPTPPTPPVVERPPFELTPPPLAELQRIARPRVAAPRVAGRDAIAVNHLTERHAYYNLRFFGGALRQVPIRVSRRLRRRLGYYRLAAPGVQPLIMISQRHIRRHGWDEAYETLLHEMIHQWQNENGLEVDHGRAFREKAREVGVHPRACRAVA